MKIEDIPRHPIEPWMFPEAQELRMDAPLNLVSLIEDGVLGNVTSLQDLLPGQVSVLVGGENSVCFYLENDDTPAVIKFRHAGSEAETQALFAWGERGLSVPRVLAHGLVPRTQDQDAPVKFLMEEAILDNDGSLSEAGHKFVAKNPDKQIALAARLGTILAEIHRVKAPQELGFGGFADVWGSGNGYDSFSEYLAGNIEFFTDTLLKEGFSSIDIASIRKAIGEVKFVERAIYAHGDYGPHNALVINGNPEDLVIFDPNPLLADPYWDIASTFNWIEIKKLKAEADPENEQYQVEYDSAKEYAQSFLSAYQAEMGDDFDESRMNAIRFARILRKINYESRKENHPVEPKVFSKAKMQRNLIELEFSKKIIRELGATIASSLAT